jgi:hypothetical protein
MKSILQLIAVTASLVGLADRTALANCDNGSLAGEYATTTSGAAVGIFDTNGSLHPFAAPQPVSGVGQITFDGAGSLSRVSVGVNSGTVLASPAPLTETGFSVGQSGTYTIAPDCTGTLTLTEPTGLNITFALVVADNGRTATSAVVKQHNPGFPPAIVPAGTTCDPGVGCEVGVNVLLQFTQVFPPR